jgi:VWFA-related protein
MHLRPNLFAFLLLTVFCGSRASAQEAKQPNPGMIQLDVVVTPTSGEPVAGLEKKDFTVMDNKVARPITWFQACDGSQEPIEVILLIDSVNTNFTTVAYERTQIDKFLQANGGHLSHPMALAILKDQGGLEAGKFSSDGNAIAASLDAATIGLRTIPRSTGFYGATERLDISMKTLQQLATYGQGKPGRRIILWVSPGWPLLSGTQGNLDGKQTKGIFDQIVSISALLRQSHTTVYAVNPLGANEQVIHTFDYENFLKGVSKPSSANIGNLGLQVIATESGGLVISSTDVAGLLERSLDDTKGYYKLSFEAAPAEQKDVYHRIDVQVGQAGLTARTRTGYYAEPN